VSFEEKNRVTVDIYGIQYVLLASSKDNISYIHMLASHVNDHMKKISQQHPRLDLPRIATLAAVNIADDYFKLKEKERQAAQAIPAASSFEALQAELQERKRREQELQRELESLRQLHDDKAAENQQIDNDDNKDELQQKYEILREEYAKLQSEFNDWIKLIEKK
jgi:cell division protein ZapA (FtsZ GTPase activity inhibitor)